MSKVGSTGWLLGGAGLILGVLIGAMMGGEDKEGIRAMRGVYEEVGAARKAIAGLGPEIRSEVTALSERVATLEESLSGLKDGQGSLHDRVEAVRSEIGAAIDKAGADTSAAVTAAISAMTPAASAPASAPASDNSAAAGDAAAGAAAQPAAGAAASAAPAEQAPPPPGSVSVSQAGSFADGKVRIYLSGTDAGTYNRSARVAVNGIDTVILHMRETVEVPVEGETCTVRLTGVAAQSASFDVTCGS